MDTTTAITSSSKRRPSRSPVEPVSPETTPIGITNVFVKNKATTCKVVVNRGGTRSSKSYSVAQLLIERFFTLKNRQILIVRKTLPSLRISTIRVVNDIISRYGLSDRVKFEKQHLNLWNDNGALIHFGSVDDPEKIKSTEWNDIWMEEATEFTYDDFVNLELRLSAPTFGHAGYRNQIHLSFNPMDEYHWIKTKLLDKRKNDIIDIHSTYLDNPYIEQDYIDTVILPKKAEDPNYWKIFGLGEWGRLDNLIYTNWDTVPELPEGDTFYGLDFGFNRPSALVRIVVDGMEATVEELLYATGLTNTKIIELMDNLLPKARRDRCPIYADNAEPQRIVEINEAGCGFRCLPANKVVLDGIDTVKRFRLHLMQDSDNLIKEIRGYSYRADKDGNVYDDPIKMNDHLMDAMRYGIHTRYFDKIKNRSKVRVRFIG